MMSARNSTYSCFQKCSRNVLFFLLFDAFRRLNVAEKKMGKSDAFDVFFPSKLLTLCIHNMPTARTLLVSLSTSLCGRVRPDLTSALSATRISHEYGRYPDVAISLAFTETIESG